MIQGEWVDPQQDDFDFNRAVKFAQKSGTQDAQGGETAGQQQADCGTKFMTMCGMCPLPDDEPPRQP